MRNGFPKVFGCFSLAAGLIALPTGCKSNPPAASPANTPAPVVDANNGPDPAAVNAAPVPAGSSPVQYASPSAAPSTGKVLGERQYPQNQAASSEQFPEQGSGQYASGQAQGSQDQYAQNQPYPEDDTAYDAGQQAIYADQPPPPLPVYQQPELTDPGDLWTPGYWNYANTGYYWVPGAWVAPPYEGALWTPGYWGYSHNRYRFHRGFWGAHIGFYGGVPYGFGYTGSGYEGGYWNQNHFYYNNAVNRLNVNVVHNVYVRKVTEVSNTRVSYNGPGGLAVRPTPSQVAVYHEQRTPPMQTQVAFARHASENRQQFFAANHGQPAIVVAPQHITAEPNIQRPQPGVQAGQQNRPLPMENREGHPPLGVQAGVPGRPQPDQRNQQLQQQNNLQQRNAVQQQHVQQNTDRQQAEQRTAQQRATQQQQVQQQQAQQQAQRQRPQADQARQPQHPVEAQHVAPARPQTPQPAPRPIRASPQAQPHPAPAVAPAPRPTQAEPRPVAPAPRPAAPAPAPAPRPAPVAPPAPAPRPPAPAPAAHPAPAPHEEGGHPRR